MTTASWDQTARVWHVPGPLTPEDVVRARLTAPRCFTPEERPAFFLDPASPSWCKAIGKWPYDAGTLENQARDLYGQRKYDEAIAAFTEALRLDPLRKPQVEPAMARAYNGRAWRLYLKGAYSEALPDAERAIALLPDSWVILDTRGQIYLMLGRIDEAFVDLDKSIALGSKDPITFYSRGQIYERRGQRDLAIADYRKALELEPGDDETNKRAQAQARERLQALGASAQVAK